MQLLNKILVSEKFQKITNKNKVSSFFGWLSDKEIPHFILKKIIQKFIQSYKINIDDFEFDIKNVKTFNQFFSRKFKENKRNFNFGIASPVEGFIASFGLIENGKLYQIKGNDYLFSDLLDLKNIPDNNSSYVTIYLSPASYHRIHAPFNMEIVSIKYIPGTLFSTSKQSLETHKNVYCNNERIILKGTSEYGQSYMILIGAIVVGRIKLSFENIVSNAKMGAVEKKYNASISLKKGEEIGWFEMGSTVILTLNNPILATLNKEIDSEILLGETLCT